MAKKDKLPEWATEHLKKEGHIKKEKKKGSWLRTTLLVITALWLVRLPFYDGSMGAVYANYIGATCAFILGIWYLVNPPKKEKKKKLKKLEAGDIMLIVFGIIALIFILYTLLIIFL